MSELGKPAVLGRDTRLVEMPISWALDDFPLFEYLRMPQSVQEGGKAASGVLENWLDDFIYMTRTVEWGVLTYTMHPLVIGRGHRMMMLERLIEGLRDRGAVFMTMAAAVDEFLQRKKQAAE